MRSPGCTDGEGEAMKGRGRGCCSNYKQSVGSFEIAGIYSVTVLEARHLTLL